MPIADIKQPAILSVSGSLRLRAFDAIPDCALSWYQDPETVWLVDGVRRPYDREILERMYRWLNAHGELYVIEVLENSSWKPIGDVTFWQEDMPIVIGDPQYRGRGIGKQVISALIHRARQLGYDSLFVKEIYTHNPASQRCFESLGFRACGQTEKGKRYCLALRRL